MSGDFQPARLFPSNSDFPAFFFSCFSAKEGIIRNAVKEAKVRSNNRFIPFNLPKGPDMSTSLFSKKMNKIPDNRSNFDASDDFFRKRGTFSSHSLPFWQ
jgi:hypothetical protein